MMIVPSLLPFLMFGMICHQCIGGDFRKLLKIEQFCQLFGL